MNCNKCGTPILPGENSCRFCGTVNDYSKRTYEEMKPEIIDFTAGDDDVVIIDDEPDNIESIPVINSVSAPVLPVFPKPEPLPVSTPVIIEDEVEFSTPNIEVMPVSIPEVSKIETTMSIPVVTPIVNEPISFMKKEEENISTLEPIEQVSDLVEETPIILESSVPSAVSSATPVIITKLNSKQSKDELIKEIMEPVAEENIEIKEKKNGHGLFNIVTFILIVLLIASVIFNCFLLMGDSEENKEVDTTSVVSTTNQTIYFSGYKVEVPSNWITVTNKDASYITIMDSTENWAFTLNVAKDTIASNIINKISIKNITQAFGANKYLFTSDYSKIVNGKDFYIFKGKYYDYSVYVITSSLDSTNTVVADLKFQGEVDDTILTSVLNSLTTVSIKDLTTFYKNDFSFSDVSSLITNNISTEIEGN